MGILSSKVSSMRLTLRFFGLAGILRLTWLLLLRATMRYQAAAIVVLPLDQLKPLRKEGFEGRFLPVDEVDASLIEAAEWTVDRVRAREAAGRRCFVGFYHGRQTCFSMVNSIDFRIGGRHQVGFPDKLQGYVGAVHTLAEFRGRGFTPALLYDLGVALRREEHRWLLAHIEADNLSSLRSLHKAGFRTAIQSSCWNLAGKQYRRWKVFPKPKGWQEFHPENWLVSDNLDE